ncbi:uncharacterized protein VTP21DRAFT_7727 [Calcarisporiella thermophila]|uniref:uncharacterized protein n=1 Tax=Calcarisporiella thermophila TaxID=911321 RepID=UPI0037429A0A
MKILHDFCIKPSITTTLPSKPIRLTGFESVTPPMYISVVCYFKKPSNLDSKEEFMPHWQLLDSLRQTIDIVPVVSGLLRAIADNSLEISFERNSMPGVHFSVAQTTSTFPDAGSSAFQPAEVAPDLCPMGLFAQKLPSPLFAARLTHYPCGSVALGINMHHRIADFSSLDLFLKLWGQLTRGIGNDKIIWDPSAITPRGNVDITDYSPDFEVDSQAFEEIFQNAAKLETRSIVFSKEALRELKAAAACKMDDKEAWISTHDALLAHLWSSITRARRVDGDQEVTCGIVIDTRPKFEPQLPANSFGSLVICKLTRLPADIVSNEEQVGRLASSIRFAINQVNNIYLRHSLEWIEKQPDKSIIHHAIARNVPESYVISSSWAKFAIYGVDFGYGTPTRVMTPPLPFEGALILPSPLHWPEGRLNVLITLPTDVLETLEADKIFSNNF